MMRHLGYYVTGFAVLLILTACGENERKEHPAAPEPSTTSSPAPAGALQKNVRLVEVALSVFKFTPKTIVLKAGEPVQFRLTSKDTLHTFTVKDLGIDVSLNPGESKLSDVITPQQTGTLQITCRVHPVSAYGMEGALEVTAADVSPH